MTLQNYTKVKRWLVCFFIGHKWSLLPICEHSNYHNTGCLRCGLRLHDLWEMVEKGNYNRVDNSTEK